MLCCEKKTTRLAACYRFSDGYDIKLSRAYRTRKSIGIAIGIYTISSRLTEYEHGLTTLVIFVHIGQFKLARPDAALGTDVYVHEIIMTFVISAAQNDTNLPSRLQHKLGSSNLTLYSTWCSPKLANFISTIVFVNVNSLS